MAIRKIPLFIAVTLLLVIGALATRMIFDARTGESQDPADGETRISAQKRDEIADRPTPSFSQRPIARLPGDIKGAPLPALDAPLADVVDELKNRAAKGDGGAACRLAAEYAHCASLPRELSEFERWLAQRQMAIKLIADPLLRQQAEADIRRELGLRENRLDEVRAHCKGSDQASPAEIARAWLDAAKAGNLPAMKNFASGNAFRWDSLLDTLPELSEYRTLAEPMAIMVAKSGDQEMMLALAAAYSPLRISSRNLLAQSVQPDRAKAIALYKFILSAMPAENGTQSAPIRDEISDRASELESLPEYVDPARIAADLADMQATWRSFGPVYGGNIRRPGEGTVKSIGRADCAKN